MKLKSPLKALKELGVPSTISELSDHTGRTRQDILGSLLWDQRAGRVRRVKVYRDSYGGRKVTIFGLMVKHRGWKPANEVEENLFLLVALLGPVSFGMLCYQTGWSAEVTFHLLEKLMSEGVIRRSPVDPANMFEEVRG